MVKRVQTKSHECGEVSFVCVCVCVCVLCVLCVLCVCVCVCRVRWRVSEKSCSSILQAVKNLHCHVQKFSGNLFRTQNQTRFLHFSDVLAHETYAKIMLHFYKGSLVPEESLTPMNLLQLLYNGKRFSRSWTLFTFPCFSEAQVVIVEESILFFWPIESIFAVGANGKEKNIFVVDLKFAFNSIAILLETLTHTTSKIAYCLSTTFEFKLTWRLLKKVCSI